MKRLQTYLSILTASAFLIGCQPKQVSQNAEESKSDVWEYTELKQPGSIFPAEELNKLGAEGWELVSQIEKTGEGGHYQKYTLKKRLNKP